MATPLMPKATAVWLVENTSLTFEQIADFCGLHALEVQAIADGEVAIQMQGLDPVVLFGDAVPNNRVDAVVGWHRAGGDLATEMASRFGCDRLQTGSAPPSTSPTPTTVVPTSGPGTPVQVPSNVTGVCDPAIQPRIDAALQGHVPIAEVIDAVEPTLWDVSTVLPILQDTTIVAAGPHVDNVNLTGPVPVGIVADAGRWVKTPQ